MMTARGIGMVVVLLAAGALQAPREATVSEFPSLDAGFFGQQQQRAPRRALEEAAAKGDSAARLDLLIRAARFSEALELLRQIVEREPQHLHKAIDVIASNTHNLTRDRAAGHHETLAQVIAGVPGRLPQLPRETAAKIAFRLPFIESDIRRIERAAWQQRMARLVAEYAGTEAAELTAANMAGWNLHGESAAIAYEHYARRHPGTIGGAQALFNAGSALRSDSGAGDRGRDPDPTDRLLRVVAIAEELQSAAWPAGEWKQQAASLVTQFHTYKPVYSPGNLEKVKAVYRDFMGRMLTVRGTSPPSIDELVYAVARHVRELYVLQSAPLDQMDALFDHWASITGQADAVRFLQAATYESWMRESRDERQRWFVKARDAFAALAASGRGVYHRRALASLASLHLQQHEFEKAIEAYERYLAAFPETPWAFLAALRLGQAFEGTGDWAKTHAAYARAASRYSHEPLAVVLGHTHAARAREAQSDFVAARDSYQKALGAWQAGYDYALHVSFFRDGAFSTPKSAMRITKELLAENVARLTRATTIAGGAMIERGRWLSAYDRWTEATAVLERFIAEHPSSPAIAEARYLRNAARLQHALDVANVERSTSDLPAALAALRALQGEPWDPAIGIAKIAEAAILLRTGTQMQADTTMRAALEEWHAKQQVPPGTGRLEGLEEDVAEIRKVAFRPAGGDHYTRERRWEAFPKAVLPPFATVKPQLPVKLSDSNVVTVSAFRAAADVPPVLFFDEQQIALLYSVVLKLGGSRTREPGQIMEVPNQPVGGSIAIVNFWNRFFNAVPGHWGGWMFETPPTVTRIEFLNPERTKASAFVTIRYEGVTLVMEKIGGVWKVTGLANRWIT